MDTIQMTSLAEIEKRYAYMAQSIREKNVCNFPDCNRLNQIKTVKDFLGVIVKCAGGCDNYDFIYFITKLEEVYGNSSTMSLWGILNNYMLTPESSSAEKTANSDIAFAALYNLIHHYYRANDEARLAELCGSEANYLGTFFNKKYYLTVELFARYTGIINHYDTQYRMSLLLHKYVERGLLPKSAALNAVYVNSVCKLCDKKFNMEQQSRFLPQKGKRARLDDSLFLREYRASPKKDYKLDFSVVADWGVALDRALVLVNESIAFNDSYAKYHYLKAKVMFYKHLLSSVGQSGSVDSSLESDGVYSSIFKELIKASDRENTKAADYELRVSTYKNFESTVSAYREKTLENAHGRNSYRLSDFEKIFESDVVPPPHRRPPIVIEKENYLFVSYSTKDFKPVYRDIIELQLHNVCLWYDVNTVVGEEWDSVVEEKIKHCTCFVCYISENSLKSPAVIKELELARKYARPVFGISLTEERIPKLISGIGGDISTEGIRLFSELFDDKKKVIVRDPQYSALGHMPILISFLEEKFSEVIDKIDVEFLCKKNSIAIKPNEDFYVADEKNNIYVVADGISRPHKEYEEQKDSVAAKVSHEFCKSFVSELEHKIAACEEGAVHRDLMYRYFSEAIKKANEKVKRIIDREWDGLSEKPGCVAVAAVIAERTLYFGNIGDCVGILVRDNRQIIFAAKQTRFAFDIVRTEKDRENLKKYYVNHPENRYGYGVINGEEGALEFLNVSHLALEPGDTIYLVSDGLSDYVEFSQCSSFVGQSVEELERSSLADSDELRKIPTALVRSYDDDRTVIKISIAK